MKILGLLGGVASGKSLVARQLAELGAVVLDADRAGHEALRLPAIEEAARGRWGMRSSAPTAISTARGWHGSSLPRPPTGQRNENSWRR